jgi:tubby-related protein 1
MQLLFQVPWRETAAVLYASNALGFGGPRRLTVLLPPAGDRTPEAGLVERFRSETPAAVLALHNKTPVWDDASQSYLLNFRGRVTRTSVKNFQVIGSSDEERVVLQFGRVSDDAFSLDYGHPMCALQAFGVALSSLDTKLACE